MSEKNDDLGTEILSIGIASRDDTTPLRFISRAQQVVYDQLVYAAGKFIEKNPEIATEEMMELRRTYRKARS